MVFKFKEFLAKQEASAAKITTDATVFAAWLKVLEKDKKVLEIGAGTGVMSLMVAQKCTAKITAVEIEEMAFKECNLNFSKSPFSDQLKVYHIGVQEFHADEKFDLIFSNPPFFKNNLQSEVNENKNTAYHTNSLTFDELALSVNNLLKIDGRAFIMLPEYESIIFGEVMKSLGFFENYVLKISHNRNKKPLRRIVGYDKIKKSQLEEEYLYIRNLDGSFHDAYIKLMKPYLTIF